MATALPITVQMGALPAAVKWTPQQLADAIAARMSLVSAQTYALFVTGSTAPTSDVGPWLKNGVEWYVWDAGTGTYVPITIDSASLGYFIGEAAPDHNLYSFWIQTTAGGSPLALKIYYSGAWVDVYATTLASYLTTAAAAATYAPIASPTLTGVPAAPTAAGGTNTTQLATTAFVTAAIAAIPAPGAFAAYPAQGTSAGAQAITPDGTPVKAVIDTAVVNPAPAPFDTANSRYIAPADGVYGFQISTQIDNNTGAAATMEISCDLYKDGVSTGIGDLDGTPSPNGGRWSPGVGGIISLVTNNYLEVYIDAADGVGTGSIDLSKVFLSVWRISA